MKRLPFNPKFVLIKFIKDARNFSKYKRLGGGENRPTDEAHIQDIMNSFKEFGADATTIIIIKTRAWSKDGSWEYYVVDGQHRSIALMRLGLSGDIKIMQASKEEFDTPIHITRYIASLNNKAKAWSTNNFLHSFATNGKREYQLLLNLKVEFGYTITDLLHIFLHGAGKKENDLFKDGQMTFPNEKDSLKMIKAVNNVKEYIPNKAYCRRRLYSVMRMKGGHGRMVKAIIRTVKAYQLMGQGFSENEVEFYNQILDVYHREFA